MTPYAHYAAKPLPCPLMFSAVLEATFDPKPHSIHPSARREPKVSDPIEDFSTATPYKVKPIPKPRAKNQTVFDKYAAVMSTRKWTSTTDIADALCATSAAVNKYLSANREKIHKRQDNSGKGYLINYWKLKCAPA